MGDGVKVQVVEINVVFFYFYLIDDTLLFWKMQLMWLQIFNKMEFDLCFNVGHMWLYLIFIIENFVVSFNYSIVGSRVLHNILYMLDMRKYEKILYISNRKYENSFIYGPLSKY